MKAKWSLIIKLSNFLLLVFLTLGMNGHLAAFGSGSPSEPEEPPTPPPIEEPEPPIEEPPKPPAASIEEVIQRVGSQVDSFHNRQDLLKGRASGQGTNDSCQIEVRDENRFMGRIVHFVNEAQRSNHSQLGGVADIYQVRSNPIPVSLNSHPMCRVNRSTLSQTLRNSNRVPSQTVINKLNRFADRYNNIRDDILADKEGAQNEMNTFWSKLMGCLAYKESLTTADTSRSRSVANRVAPGGYRKPAGVKFYEDPNQAPASRLNIGLFQFTPDSRGNVRACINRWNSTHPSCRISTSSSQGAMINNVGSSQQNFNTFCGVDKILQTFYVQTNTTRSRNTHPQNANRSPQDRCVSLHFYAGYAYNHFGPFPKYHWIQS